MFAFAMWDAKARRLLLARDRVGIKPLYYAEPAEGGLVFGSEIKSILQDPAVDAAWSPEALDAYLTLLYVPAPATIYRQISQASSGTRARRRTRLSAGQPGTGISSSPAPAIPLTSSSIWTSSTRC